jgi:sterol desaturase/sphingolipid hydroxylase (fatty acid hydroxylase superfamily)
MAMASIANPDLTGFAGISLATVTIAVLLLVICEVRYPAIRGCSSRASRWPANLGLGLINLAVASVMPVSGVLAAKWAGENGVGVLNILEIQTSLAIATAILMRSLVDYARHRAMHEISWLWRFHRVHHSDEVVDVSTAARIHWGELAVSAVISAVGMIFIGAPVLAIIIYDGLDAAFGAFQHSNIRLPRVTEMALRPLIMTPELHRVHHSVRCIETNTNFGGLFSFWDRLFATYRSPAKMGVRNFGLQERRGNTTCSLRRLLMDPLTD